MDVPAISRSKGRADLNQAMMEGSKTGKAAEADLMVLIGKTQQAEGEEEDPVRYLNIAKNKLNGYQGKITCVLDGSRSVTQHETSARRREYCY